MTIQHVEIQQTVGINIKCARRTSCIKLFEYFLLVYIYIFYSSENLLTNSSTNYEFQEH